MATRTFYFSYGAITIGGASESSYILHSPIVFSLDYRQLTATCKVLLRGANTADMETKRAALEANFRIPFQTLEVSYAGTLKTYSHSANTGFNQQPSIERDPEEGENALLAVYTVTVTLDLPADRAGDEGLLDLKAEFTVGPSDLKTLNFSGVYTAIGGNSAKLQYASKIGALTTSIQNEFDATARWEPTALVYDRDKENKHVSFDHSYIETIDREDSAGTNVAYIRQARTIISVDKEYSSPLPRSGQERAERIVVNFTCLITKAQATLSEAELRRIWIADVLPNIRERLVAYQAANNKGAGKIVILALSPTFDTATPGMSAYIEGMVMGTNLLAGTIVKTLSVTPPFKTLPVFSGDLFEKVVIPQVGMAVVIRSASALVRGSQEEAYAMALSLLPPIEPRIDVGLGAQSLGQLNRFSLAGQDITKDWTTNLDQYMAGAIEVEYDGPQFVGFDTEEEMNAVKISQEIEYFRSSIRPTGGRIVSLTKD